MLAALVRTPSLSLVSMLVVVVGCGGTAVTASPSDAAADRVATADASGDAGADGGADVVVDDAAACAAMPATTPDLATTDRGTVRGVVDGAVRSFKGIPYAAPPVGALRWRSPQPAACFGAVRDATSFGSACAQLDATGTPSGSEDCLTLNVWAPTARPASPLPVLFFLHGGANYAGSTEQVTPLGVRIYDGAWLAEHGPAVVVTANYRLGPFGFVGHPALTAESPNHASGNFGLLDQIAALRWVQANAASFGGDPSRVMLFGESAGGLDTCALLTSPLAEGLFARAAIESGGCVASTQAVAEAGGTTLASSLCASATDALGCLRGVAMADVLRALPGSAGVTPGATGYRYQLAVDGYALLEAPMTTIAAGHQRHVPVVIGNNRDEMSYFFPPTPANAAMTDAQYRALVTTQFGAAGGATILAAYPSAMFPSPYFAYVDMLSDAVFICPARRIARALAGAMSEPVRRYLFTHSEPGIAAAYGAAHAFELSYVFHNLPTGATADQTALADTVAGYWLRFAATGDPNGGGATTWPTYAAAADPYLTLDSTPAAAAGYHALRCDAWDRLSP